MNTEATGYAHAAWLSHGTGVSEVGLTVADPQGAVTRAAMRDAPAHADTHGPGELPIPGIRGVGGSALRFLQAGAASLWDVDFAVDQPAHAGAGLVAVDHIAQTMAYDEMLSWSLFYTSIFDAEKSPMVDVADPDGLVRSQAIRAGALRVTLNGAESRRTLAGRFIEDTFGSSVQHLAFRTEDIFATATAMQDRGFPILKIGANYYDDVEARFGLEPALRRRMQALNIMYDEEPGGQFFQFYSEAQPGGLFLEVVQRNGNFQGYGAPNAPFRIAAQKRTERPAGMPAR